MSRESTQTMSREPTEAMSRFIIERDVPEKPHQPKTYRFPKRSFGQKTVVYRGFQPDRFLKWPFLHYEESWDEVFCHTCLMACKLNRMKTRNVDPAFVSCYLIIKRGVIKDMNLQVERGFHNWKDGTIGFRKHEECASHKEAVKVMVVLPATTTDIGEHLSHEHASQKLKNQQALYLIITCLRYLCRQGLAVRGDADESDSNLHQLLRLQSKSDCSLAA